MSHVRSTILFIRGHSMECRSHTNEFEFWYVRFDTSFMSLFMENWNCRFQFYENYKNDRAKCSKRDSIIRVEKISRETRYLDEMNFIIVRFQESL